MRLLTIVTVAIGGMSAVNIFGINSSVNKIESVSDTSEMPSFDLSKDGKNVVVIMLDRAMNEYIPYILKEKPELQEKFDGFTYYNNVISHAFTTNTASPALFGGYEYTPVEMNKRDTELLSDKHNEALKVMPAIFKENGYDVTVCDPPYAGYTWIPQLSVFDDLDIDAYITEGAFTGVESQAVINNNYRNFFCFSVMKSMPVFLQSAIYDDGNYCQIGTATVNSVSSAPGFMKSYRVMENLSRITNVVKDEKNTFLYLANNMTHEPTELQTPDYVPAETVDNSAYDAAQPEDRFVIDGMTANMDTEMQVNHYHINMSAMLRLAEWFDYLREQGVYDNTRIILVSDHGSSVAKIEQLVFNANDRLKNPELYYPLLMVKDFDSTGFTTNSEFMTNADVPTLATQGVIESPVNPYTGKPINSDEKTAHDQMVYLSDDWELKDNSGYTFNASQWASVHDDMRVRENWEFGEEALVLKEYSLD